MTFTDYMCQEKEEEEDFPELNTVWKFFKSEIKVGERKLFVDKN